MVEGFEHPSDPGSYVLGVFMPLVGSPKANRSWVTGQTKSGSEAPYDEKKNKASYVAKTGVTGAPPWSQAWGGRSTASVWWPGLSPQGPAGHSPKERRGAVLPWTHHPQEDP